jgi:citrate synthase
MDVMPGLENVVAAETRLSDVDGERGRLVIAGADVERMEGGFEEVAAALWSAAGLDGAAMAAKLGPARVEAFSRVPSLGAALDVPDGMEALRGAMGQLRSTGELARDAVDVTAAAAVLAAAWARRRAGQPVLAPDPAAGHADDFLRMASGSVSPARSRALDRYLATVSDHGMNASTFVARVVTSTGSDVVSSVVAAIGALKGPLHGGAPGPVLDMLDAIGTADRAKAWLAAELAAGRRIMGMGHRIYRVRDPRAAVFERALETMAAALPAGATERLALARAVEREATSMLTAKHPERPIAANVEFYTAVLLEAVGLPRALFSPTFAVGRVLGWTAHAAEQARTGRLIRPASRYVGPRPD